MFGKKAREIKAQAGKIAELEAKLSEMTQQNTQLSERVNAFESKEATIVRVLTEATTRAGDIVKEAEETSYQKLTETQAQLNDYAALLTSYDKLVQENVKNAEESSRRYAELSRQLHAVVAQVVSADGKLIDPPKMQEQDEEPAEQEAAAETEAAEDALVTEEKVWTVSELSEEPEEPTEVDEIIETIIEAAQEQ